MLIRTNDGDSPTFNIVCRKRQAPSSSKLWHIFVRLLSITPQNTLAWILTSIRNSNLITFTSFSLSVNQTPNIHLLIPIVKLGLTLSVPKDPIWNVSPHINILVLLIFDKSFNKGYWKVGSCQIQLKVREKLICMSFTGFLFSQLQFDKVVSITIIADSQNMAQTGRQTVYNCINICSKSTIQ